MATTDPARVTLRQMAATLAYRAAKVLREFAAKVISDDDVVH